MKPTTKVIQNWINDESNIKQMESFFTNNVDHVAHETTMEEAKGEFDYLIEQLTFLIENGELDKLTFHKRNGINALLTNLSNQLVQFKRYNYNYSRIPNVGSSIISYILSLRDQIDTVLFSTKGKGASDYVNESKELVKIKKRYNKLVKDIELVEEEKTKVSDSNKTLLEKIDDLKEKLTLLEKDSTTIANLNNQIQTLHNQISANAEDVESKKITISALHKSAKELEKIYAESSSGLKKLKATSTSTINEFVKEKSKLVEERALEFSTKTKEIVNKNITLQEKINTLLEGANAGELYKAFNTRKKDIEDSLNYWFWGIIGINVFLVFFTLLIINGSAWLSIDPLNPEQLDSAFYLKLFISIPLLFLDWFIIRQYNQRKDLAERYAFKSVLSLSLLAYNEMMVDHKDNNVSLDFISKTVDKIYESPFDTKSLTKKELDVLNRFAEKGLEKAESVKKVID